VAAAVAGAAGSVALAGPATALACSGSTSAVNVYKECLPSGGKSSTGAGPQSGGSGHSSGPAAPSGQISGQAAKAVKHAGKDSRALAHVVRTGPTGLLRSSPSSVPTEPSAVGSAFDLGSGPAAFLIALAGSAVLLLAGSGLRIWRHRRP
jgi:hypothetical protein